jgi:hypothetical protein
MLKKNNFIFSHYLIFLFFLPGLFFSWPAFAVVEVNQTIPANPAVKQEQVKVGIYLNNVQNIDMLVNNYLLDFYIWMRWTNEDFNPLDNFSFINHSESWATIVIKSPETPEKLPNGEMYQMLHIQGRMSEKMDLRAYPFDLQNLLITMEDKAFDSKSLVYVPEEVSVNPDLQIPGFDFGKPTLSESSFTYPTFFGYRGFKGSNVYSRLTFELPIYRNPLTSFIKNILPIWLSVFCGAFALMLRPKLIDSRFTIVIFSILSLIALQLTNGNDLPALQYMNFMDAVYVASYLFMITLMAEITFTSRLVENDNSLQIRRAQRIDRWFCVAYVSLFLLVNAWMLLYVFV